jgi:predicted ATPase
VDADLPRRRHRGSPATELGPILSEAGAQPSDDASGAARFRVFDAAAAILRSAATRQPLLLVFDDMHAADESSLLLLRFCARELARHPSSCSAPIARRKCACSPRFARQFADLSRDARRLRLSGWEPPRSPSVSASTRTTVLSLDLGPAIQRLTEGNPFFVKEVAREIAAGLLQPATLLDDTTPMPLPDGVRETIQRRLSDLPEELRPLLRLAALIGREFDGAALHRLANQRAPIALSELAALLAHAVAAGLVTEARDRAGSYAFSHALVRETLRNEVSPIERMSLHLAIGEALEGDGGDEEMAARLAYHFFQANAAGGAAKAVHYARLAAAAARARVRLRSAAALTQRALDALRFLPPDEPRRCELLIALGRAQRRAGRIPEARAAFRRAAQIARDIGEVDLAATAALGFGQVGETGRVDADLTRLLSDSLTLLGETDSALRCRHPGAPGDGALLLGPTPPTAQRRDAMSAGRRADGAPPRRSRSAGRRPGGPALRSCGDRARPPSAWRCPPS